MSFFLDLPPELFLEIFSYFEYKDLLKAGLVCRGLYNTIANSVDLRYTIELAADDMVDGPRGPGTMSTAQRLALLVDRRERWRTLDWVKQINVPVQGTCHAYELVGGVFAKSMGLGSGGARHLITTWLPTSTKNAETSVREDVGVPARDFAIDPSQDLIAFVNVDDSLPTNVCIRVHLRTISSNRPHKGAAKAELQLPVFSQIGNCFIQIVNDVVGMFFWLHGPGLIVWNWRKGETVVACLSNDGRPTANLAHAFLPQPPPVARELHPGTWDFAFLSSRAYFLTTVGGRGSIEIYSLQGQGTGPTKHVASLMLPQTIANVEMHHFSTHSSPFLGGDITQGKPFAASQGNRVHLMSFHYGQDGPRFHLFVKNSFLLSFVEKSDGWRRTLRWEEWGPDNTRFLEHNVQFQWLRYVHGQRVVLPPLPVEPTSGHLNPFCRACVLDFNVHPKRTNDPCDIGYAHGTTHMNYELFDSESVIPAGEVFEQAVVSRLPYSVASRRGPYVYSGFLIDEERLIGMKLSMTFVEGDLSDIDVFTF